MVQTTGFCRGGGCKTCPCQDVLCRRVCGHFCHAKWPQLVTGTSHLVERVCMRHQTPVHTTTGRISCLVNFIYGLLSSMIWRRSYFADPGLLDCPSALSWPENCSDCMRWDLWCGFGYSTCVPANWVALPLVLVGNRPTLVGILTPPSMITVLSRR